MVRVENAEPTGDPFFGVFKNKGFANPRIARLEEKRQEKRQKLKKKEKMMKKKDNNKNLITPQKNFIIPKEGEDSVADHINKINEMYQAQKQKRKSSQHHEKESSLKNVKIERKFDDEEEDEDINHNLNNNNNQNAKDELEEEEHKPLVVPEPTIVEKPKHFAWNMTDQKFSALEISTKTKEALELMGFKNLTEIQARAIPHLLGGEDILAKAKTGSGKTLAFLIPAIELLFRSKFTPQMGTGAVVIAPTRELALQIYAIAHELLQKHTLTHGLLIGGANRKAEAEKLAKGCNLVIATPGRLLDHLTNTRAFRFATLKALIVDETDRILDTGFEEDLRKIIKILPKKRQTMLFSATQTSKVEDIARLALQNAPVMVNADAGSEKATVDLLEQGYIVVPSEDRFLVLLTFLKKNLKKKVIVFFSSCKSVKFHAELMNYIDVPVYELRGTQKQNKRTHTFFEFCNATSGILLCTDVVARGLDIPKVDWIIQFDPPDDPKEYIHRVGRTARAGTAGKALLFLLPSEVGFLLYLKREKVPLDEFEFPKSKILNIQALLENLIEKNYYLHNASRDAYRGYILAYASHQHKHIFDVTKLDLIKVAKSFGFSNPPRVDFNLNMNPEKRAKKREAVRHGGKEK